MELKGIPVTLYTTTQTGTDDFGAPIETETAVTVDNVLVGSPSSEDIVNSTELYGKRVVYNLAIPKGDTHDWTDKKVSFFGQTFRVFGLPVEGIEAMIPLSWNKQIMVERYA